MNLVIFPNQLFAVHPGLALNPTKIILVENPLFFGDERYTRQFHKQKLWLHRASMKRYEADLSDRGFKTEYVEFDVRRTSLQRQLRNAMVPSKAKSEIYTVDPVDFILNKRLREAGRVLGCEIHLLPNPGFMNTADENQEYRQGKSRWFMADFYKWQRKRFGILMDGDEPVGDKWSFDKENRKRIPNERLGTIPTNLSLDRDEIDTEAQAYVEAKFPDNPGSLSRLYYPTSHRDAKRWLQHFLEHRFADFGAFEDSIAEGESWLWHSVLTPALNIGLLTPEQVVDAALDYADQNDIPINSVEGFIRQIIGWREFMRATYEDLGVPMRTTNYWKHHRAMPRSFYDATTGIAPVDDTIQRILDTGYCHHIERLMVLGGFMFLCEIDPDEIYDWFMEMFVDSYDWVMVPNVYAMSQNADGGAITTKPYFSGSAYIRKMSHHQQADWCDVWDGLYWRWIWNHVDELAKNPRWAMMCSMVKKMDAQKRDKHLRCAESFLTDLGK